MENTIKIFENAEFGKIRTVEVNNEPYFVGKDVADILGYERPTKAILDHIDEEDKDEVPIQDSIGRMQKTPIINESGLYSLILSSKLPTAKKFKRWVTSEVLPAIRKTGGYIPVNETDSEQEILAKAYMISMRTIEEQKNKLTLIQEQNSQLSTTVATQSQQITELQPKASYYDVVLNCKDLVSVTAIAKDYGKSAVWLNNYLHEKGVQFKQGSKIWLLYQKYAEMGYTSTKTQAYAGTDGDTHTKVHTYWTQKGRLFIYALLKSDNVLPVIECEEKSA